MVGQVARVDPTRRLRGQQSENDDDDERNNVGRGTKKKEEVLTVKIKTGKKRRTRQRDYRLGKFWHSPIALLRSSNQPSEKNNTTTVPSDT
jgi:hypothetical protein